MTEVVNECKINTSKNAKVLKVDDYNLMSDAEKIQLIEEVFSRLKKVLSVN